VRRRKFTSCRNQNGVGAISAALPDMERNENSVAFPASKPISVGLTCWLWQWSRRWTMIQLAKHLNVTLEITQHRHGLRWEIEGHVSGENVDRFISEFARRC
jgi:hypothetical protein